MKTGFRLLGAHAAEMAFFFALSFVPFLGLTVALVTTWLPPALGEELAAGLLAVLPPEASVEPAAIAAWVASARDSGWLSANLVLAALTSFGFMSTCLRALGVLVGAGPARWAHRLLALLGAVVLVVIWMAALLVAAFLFCLGPAMVETLAGLEWLPFPALMWAVGRQVVLGLVLLLAMRLTFGAVRGLGAGRARLWLGAATAAAGWLAGSWAFTRLVPLLWLGNDLYGALASFMLFLLWAYANAWLLLAGGMVAGRR